MDVLTGVGILVGIATGTGGLLLGFDNRRARERERLEREKDRDNVRSSVRTLIKSELEHNRAALQTFWQDTVMVFPVGTPLEQQFKQRLAVVVTPWPSWQRTTWNTLTPELALAIEPDLQRE